MIQRFERLSTFAQMQQLHYENLLQEYIHRVGRTARGEGSSGHALLILRPEEVGFLKYLKQAKVPLNEFEFSWSKIADIQLQVSNFCNKLFFILRLSCCYVYKDKHLSD